MPIAQTLLPEFDHEMANTRRLLALVPAADAAWKPHPSAPRVTFPNERSTPLRRPANARAFLRIRDLETVPSLAFDRPVVADLSARFRVEGSLGDDQLRLGPFASRVDLGAGDEYSEHLGLRRIAV